MQLRRMISAVIRPQLDGVRVKLVYTIMPAISVTVATVVDLHGGVTLQLRTTVAAAVRPKRRQPKPPAVPKTVDQLSFRELRQLSVMTGIGAQVVSDLYAWPPHKHRGVKPSTAPFSLTSPARRVGTADTAACRQVACCCPDTGDDGGGKLHRWPCTYMDVAAGTATSYAKSMVHDEEVAIRRAAKRATAKGVATAPRESGWAKSDNPGSPRWARPPNAVQAANFEARRQHNARHLLHHQGLSGASVGVGGPVSVMETGGLPQSPVQPTPPEAEQQAGTSPRRKPTQLPRQLKTPRTAPSADSHMLLQNKLYHHHVVRS